MPMYKNLMTRIHTSLLHAQVPIKVTTPHSQTCLTCLGVSAPQCLVQLVRAEAGRGLPVMVQVLMTKSADDLVLGWKQQ